ncbi:MAG: hypothetical protein ACM3PP_12710 [Candidatus Saccharibacteria bacterium]
MFKNRHSIRLSITVLALIITFALLLSGCSDDKPHYGTWTAPDGSQYKGYLLNGQPEGKGELVTPNGIKYVGDFKNGMFNGKGVKTQPDGNKFDGEFKDGKLNGKVIWTDSKGIIRTELFQNDIMVKQLDATEYPSWDAVPKEMRPK